jgi:hypothetical protein
VRARAWTALAVAGAALLVHERLFGGYTVDDAFINFRYARNVGDGLGFVYNAGDAPVMGFVDTLWILLLAAVGRLGFELAVASKWIGSACSLGALFLATRLSRRIGGMPEDGIPLAPLFCAAAGPFALWTASGMETGLYALLLAGAVVALLREWKTPLEGAAAGFLFALATTVRPEALGVAAAACAVLAVARAKGKGRLAFLLGLCLPLAAYAAWIRATFPDPLPNPFYAKGTPGDPRLLKIGIGYALSFVTTYGGPAFLAIAPLFGLVAKGPARAAALACGASVLAAVAYAVAIGGDWMEGHRFFAPLLPLWFALVERGIRAVLDALRAAGRVPPVAARAVALGALLAGVAVPTRRLPLPPETGHAHASVIEWFRRNAAPGARVALWDVGAIPYRTGLRVVDFAGLTDRTLTRELRMRPFSPLPYERADGEAVVRHILERAPDFVVLKMDGDRPVPTELSDVFFASSEFRRRYRRVGEGEITSRYGVFRRTGEG